MTLKGSDVPTLPAPSIAFATIECDLDCQDLVFSLNDQDCGIRRRQVAIDIQLDLGHTAYGIAGRNGHQKELSAECRNVALVIETVGSVVSVGGVTGVVTITPMGVEVAQFPVLSYPVAMTTERGKVHID